MGIKGLTKLIRDNVPGAIKETSLKGYTGMKICIDASNALYQFMVAIRSMGQGGAAAAQLTNADGEVTSHISGMFARTIRMMELGLKPVWVFDGKPPDMKGGELAKRSAAKKKAREGLEKAKEAGDVDAQNKFQKRSVRVTDKHNDDVKTLFSLMGVPVVESPCEAEAQCAALAAGGLCYGAASEDMDTLCFNSPVLLRKFTAAESKKIPVMEINLQRVLEGLGFTYPEFVDLCMLLGCDYMDKIDGIGPVKALALMKEHRTIEAVIASLQGTKYKLPASFDYLRARELFLNHPVLDPAEMTLKWGKVQEEELLRFLVDEKGFNLERTQRQIARLIKAKSGSTQKRMDSFFTRVPGSMSSSLSKKRKAEALKKKNKGKGKKKGKR
jgi:flap endonuclease-1